jgi:hypothetical protein
MNDPIFLALAVILIAAAVFYFAPRRNRHLAVLGFLVLVLVIALIGLPIKVLFVLIAGAAAAFGAQWIERNS